MSSSHHDDSHSNEAKPVSFTVPFILASVLIFIIVMFLSLCDPKPHHGEHHEAAATSHDASKEAATEKSESSESYEAVTPVDSTGKDAEAHH